MNPQLGMGVVLGILLLALAVVGQQWQDRALTGQLSNRDLDRALPAQAQLESYRGESLHIRTSSLSDDQAFVAYIAQALESADLPGLGGDASSVADLLGERAGQLGFELAAVLSNEGEVRASSSALLGRGLQPVRAALLDSADAGEAALAMLLLAEQPMLVAISSMQRGGSFDGYLLAGVQVDGALLEALAASSGNAVGLFHVSADRVRPLQASTGLTAQLPAYATALLASAQTGAPWATGVLEPSRMHLRVAGQEQPVQLGTLFADPQFLLVYAARDDTAAAGELLRLPWAAVGFGAVLLLATYLLWLQLSMFGPLQQIPVHLEAAARGDFHRRVPLTGGALARRYAIAINALLQRLRS